MLASKNAGDAGGARGATRGWRSDRLADSQDTGSRRTGGCGTCGNDLPERQLHHNLGRGQHLVPTSDSSSQRTPSSHRFTARTSFSWEEDCEGVGFTCLALFVDSEDLECFAAGSGDCTDSSCTDVRLFGAIFPAMTEAELGPVKFRKLFPHRVGV